MGLELLAGSPAPAPVQDRNQTPAPSTNVCVRDARGRIISGTPNPGGRPKALAGRVRDLVDFDQAINTLVEIAWGKLAPAARIADRIKAIELLMDRGYGKPSLTVDVKENSAANASFKNMSTPRLVATVEAMRQLAAPDDVTDAELIQ